MIFVTSDTHFNHKNICRGTSEWESGNTRPFDTLDDMNDCIIDNINSVVKADDTLFHLGDFAFGNKKLIPSLRDRIKCKTIHLIKGNHDRVLIKYYSDSFTSINSYVEVRFKKVLFSMEHYPLGSWNEIGLGGINLYGHCHGGYNHNVGRQMDVGVDCNNFQPLSIELIYEYMTDIEPVLVDGHDENTSYG